MVMFVGGVEEGDGNGGGEGEGSYYIASILAPIRPDGFRIGSWTRRFLEPLGLQLSCRVSAV